MVIFTTSSVNLQREVIGKFKEGTKDAWEKCNCEDFEKDYCKSMNYYTVISFAMICMMLLKLIVAICFCCCSEKPKDNVNQ